MILLRFRFKSNILETKKTTMDLCYPQITFVTWVMYHNSFDVCAELSVGKALIYEQGVAE